MMHPAVQQILCEARSTLLETEWEPLIKAKPGDSLLDNLTALYELEYKYGRLSILKPGGLPSEPEKAFFRSTPVRHENVVKRLEGAFFPIGQKIADQLSQVYEKWLSAHTLDNPKLWGAERAEQAMDYDDGAQAYDLLACEYNNRMFEAGRMTNSNGPPESDIVERLEDLPELSGVVDDLYASEKDEWERDEDYDDGEEEDGRSFIYSDAKEWFESLLENHGGFDKLWNNFLKDSMQAEEILAEMYGVFVFPPWFHHWKEQGIVETREKLADANEKLKKLSGNPRKWEPKDFLGTLNQIIQISHQTGPMLDYITSDYPDVDAYALEALTDSDTEEWDEELGETGVLDPKKPHQYPHSTSIPPHPSLGMKKETGPESDPEVGSSTDIRQVIDQHRKKRIDRPGTWPKGKTAPATSVPESFHPAVRGAIMECFKKV